MIGLESNLEYITTHSFRTLLFLLTAHLKINCFWHLFYLCSFIVLNKFNHYMSLFSIDILLYHIVVALIVAQGVSFLTNEECDNINNNH